MVEDVVSVRIGVCIADILRYSYDTTARDDVMNRGRKATGHSFFGPENVLDDWMNQNAVTWKVSDMVPTCGILLAS